MGTVEPLRATGAPAIPADQVRRIELTSQRRQLLQGDWVAMLRSWVVAQISPIRAQLVGQPDTAENLFKGLTTQIAQRYSLPPTIRSTEPEAAEGMRLLMSPYFSGMAQLLEEFTLGLRNAFVYVGWDPDMGRPVFRVVAPDSTLVEASEYDPSRPIRIAEAVRRPSGGEMVWTWNVWSIVGDDPYFKILNNDRSQDLTAIYSPDLVGWRGAGYPYRDESGAPILPYQLYSAKPSGNSVFQPGENSEQVVGTLQIGLLNTTLMHAALRASWSQRVILGGLVRGTSTDAGISYQVADPTTILQIESSGDSPPSIGEWGSPLSMEEVERTTRRYAARLAVHYGLSPADLVVESLNPASGASITVSRAGIRNLQLRSTAQFSASDLSLLARTVYIARSWDPAYQALPAYGYTIAYNGGLALTPTERVQVDAYCASEFGAGVLDRVGWYQETHPGSSPQDARIALQAIDRARSEDSPPVDEE